MNTSEASLHGLRHCCNEAEINCDVYENNWSLEQCSVSDRVPMATPLFASPPNSIAPFETCFRAQQNMDFRNMSNHSITDQLFDQLVSQNGGKLFALGFFMNHPTQSDNIFQFHNFVFVLYNFIQFIHLNGDHKCTESTRSITIEPVS